MKLSFVCFILQVLTSSGLHVNGPNNQFELIESSKEAVITKSKVFLIFFIFMIFFVKYLFHLVPNHPPPSCEGEIRITLLNGTIVLDIQHSKNNGYTSKNTLINFHIFNVKMCIPTCIPISI